MNKIRKVDSASTPRPVIEPATGATAGVAYDTRRGLVLNHDNQNGRSAAPPGPPFVIPDFRKYVTLFDDFVGPSVDATKWTITEGSDSSTSGAAIAAGSSGLVRLTTGDDAGASMAANGIQLDSQLNFRANNKHLAFEVRLKISAITNVCVFVGLTDQVGTLEMPFTLGASDALTSNATDAVGFLFDTAADTDQWFKVGVANNVDGAHESVGVAPVASTNEVLRVEVDENGTATFYRNGVQIGTPMKSAVRTNIPLSPVVAAFSRTNATRTVDVDYIWVGQSREA